MQAYEEVLKAWHYQWKFTPEAIDRGRQCYVKAIELDPNFALPYSGYAHSFGHFAVLGLMSPHEAMTELRRLATKALELDPSLAEAHGLLGIVASVYDYDWREAERRFGLAIGYDPVPPLVRAWRGYWLLQIIGRAREAIPDQERAIREDPLNYVLRFSLGTSLMVEKDFAKADAQFLKSVELAEKSFFPFLLFTLSLAAQERFADALAHAETAHTLGPWSCYAMGSLAGLAACNGQTARSEELLVGIAKKQTHDAPMGLAIAHILRNDFEEAAAWASRGIDARLGFLPVALQFPFADTFRRSSHCPALARKLNLHQLGQ